MNRVKQYGIIVVFEYYFKSLNVLTKFKRAHYFGLNKKAKLIQFRWTIFVWVLLILGLYYYSFR